MKIRDDVLTSQEDIGTSGTKQWDIDYADVISGLDLRFGATVGANGSKNINIERCVSKIEIVDGGEALWTLPGDVAYALHVQEHGNGAYEYYTGAQNGTPVVTIPIRFGRELYDPDFGFVPRNFKNPQLKVTFNEATDVAAGADGFVSDSFVLSIVARLMEDAPTPGAFLSAMDVHDFTSVASGDKKVPMPTDYPWRQLFVRVYEAGTHLSTTVTNYKLSCDRGKFVPFDSNVRYLIDRMCEVYPICSKSGYPNLDTGDIVYTWMGIDLDVSCVPRGNKYMVGITSPTPGQFYCYVSYHDGTAQQDKPVYWTVRGWAPHNTLFVPFGRLNVPAEWFQAQGYENVELYLTQADAGAEVNVCVQQARSY